MNFEGKEKVEPFINRILEGARYIFYFELIGVVYSVIFFAGFGLNFADFANLSDFFLLSFKEPIVFIIACAVVLLMVVKPIEYQSLTKVLGLMFLPIVTAVLMAIFGILIIKEFNQPIPFSNTGTEVKVHLGTTSLRVEPDQKINSTRFLGRVGGYFFFYDLKKGGTVENMMIIPDTEIVRIDRERPR